MNRKQEEFLFEHMVMFSKAILVVRFCTAHHSCYKAFFLIFYNEVQQNEKPSKLSFVNGQHCRIAKYVKGSKTSLSATDLNNATV